jgi:hypothetical protein
MDDTLRDAILENMSARQPLSTDDKFAIWKRSSESKPNRHGFVSFGGVARILLGQQCQYAVRYADKRFAADYRWLGEGLRFTGNFNNYHSVLIHKKDVREFVRRYRAMV